MRAATKDDADDLLHAAHELSDDVVALRRTVHAQPEIGLDLPRTQATVLDALDGLGLRVTCGKRTTSVIAVLEGARPGPTTLLRGDMDALPLTEETGLPFASTMPGSMHACGHDAHVAMLVGAAQLLAARRSGLAGRVVFMFQPGEEGYAGAKVMLEEGLLERYGPVDRAFALHVTPWVPSGSITTRPGTFMASSDRFRITVNGAGGHASMPHDAVDPVPVACEIVTALQAFMTRRIPVFDPGVATVTMLSAGTAFNVIPDAATLEGTVRAVSEHTRAEILEGLRLVADGVTSAHRCHADVAILDGYPPTINDDTMAAHAHVVAEELLGPERSPAMEHPIMGAEDWSFVLQRVPGAMAYLGVGVPGVGHPAPNHSSRMMLDEDALPFGVAMHAAMALRPMP